MEDVKLKTKYYIRECCHTFSHTLYGRSSSSSSWSWSLVSQPQHYMMVNVNTIFHYFLFSFHFFSILWSGTTTTAKNSDIGWTTRNKDIEKEEWNALNGDRLEILGKPLLLTYKCHLHFFGVRHISFSTLVHTILVFMQFFSLHCLIRYVHDSILQYSK